MASIRLTDVEASYQLLTVRDYNLKRRLANAVQRNKEQPRTIHALRRLDLTLGEGSRLGVVGANGAGKSTLLSVMAGLLPPTSGRVEVQGKVLALVGRTSAGMHQEATGRDNVFGMGVQLGESPASMRGRLEDIVSFSGLERRIDDPVYTYSTGMQTRLRFSILTSLRPDVLLLDEGLGTADAEFTRHATDRLRSFMSAAGIVVLASHGDQLLRDQCEEAIWLHRGVLQRRGPLDAVLTAYHASYVS